MSNENNPTGINMQQGGKEMKVGSEGTITNDGTQASHIADPTAAAALTTDLTGVDTGTDMTAAQAAQIEADLTALKAGVDANNAAIDSILAALEGVGITASS